MKKISLVLLLPFLMLACAKPTGFDYLGISSFKVLSFGLKQSTVAVSVKYYNPNKFPVTMKNAAVDVYVNNNYFGKTSFDSTIKIAGRDTFDLPVILTVDMKNTGLGILQTLGKEEVLIKMDGKARIGRGGLFINYPIKYEGMQKLNF
ncbi:MAG: LEA type 2 family protein [Chitinophagaceae bacterium]